MIIFLFEIKKTAEGNPRPCSSERLCDVSVADHVLDARFAAGAVATSMTMEVTLTNQLVDQLFAVQLGHWPLLPPVPHPQRDRQDQTDCFKELVRPRFGRFGHGGLCCRWNIHRILFHCFMFPAAYLCSGMDDSNRDG